MQLQLHPAPTFDLARTVWALRRRDHNIVERWEGTTYRRVLVLGSRPAPVAVRQAGSTLDDGAAVERLEQLRGVGRWTAEYALLRGLGRLHVFSGDDVGARRRLERWLGLRRPSDYAGVRHIVARWQPWAGMIYFHLLLRGPAERGTDL